MNRKKILQIMLATTTLAGGISLSHEIAMATPVDQNSFIQGTLTAPGMQRGKIVNVTTNLRVRSGASINSSVIGYLNNSSDVSIITQEGQWYKISFNGRQGYISRDYVQSAVTQVAVDTTSKATAQNGQVINVSTTLNIRQAASASSAVLGTLKNGSTFQIIARSGGWYNIKTGSIVGFVSSDYVKELSSGATSETPKPTATVTAATSTNGTIVNISTNLRVRSTAGTGGQIVGYLLNGTKVTITGESGSWYQIKYNNASAYISKDYVQKDAVPVVPAAPVVPATPAVPVTPVKTSTIGKVVNVSSTLRVRQTNSTSGAIIGSLKNGQTVNIIEESGDWYKIEYSNTSGYVFKEYIQKGTTTEVTKPSGGTVTPVQVDKNEQKGQVINVSTNLRIRAQASTTSKILGYLINGQVVTIKGKTSDWYKISYNGIEGYISDSYIKIVDSAVIPTTPTVDNGTTYNNIINAMKAHLGSPYVWGGSGELLTTSLINTLKARYPYQTSQNAYSRAQNYADKGYRAFDCSGLMQWGFKQAGVNIGRSTWDQIVNGVEVPINQIKPGDLLFYKSLEHVGMYIGNGQWIEAPNKKADVRITSVPWGNIGRARRVL